MKIRKLTNRLLYAIIAIFSILLVCSAGSDNFNILFFVADLAALIISIFILRFARR